MSTVLSSDEKKQIKFAFFIPIIFLTFFWLITILETALELDFYYLGVFPLKLNGLLGIVTAPFKHQGFQHLISNSLPFLILSVTLFFFYREISFPVFMGIWLFSGFYTWIAGRPSWHIGSSGIIYGLFAFIMLSGLIRNHKELIAISLMVIFLYGGMVWGFWADLFPKNTSFEAHTGGLIAGTLLAIFYRKRGPQKMRYSWELEEDEEKELYPYTIAVDGTLPYIKGVFEGVAQVRYLMSNQFTAENLYDVDAMVIRSVVCCNRQLLERIPVKCIASATIGFDHIDTNYCEETGIKWFNAPGCNSGSVMQYIAAALSMYSLEKNILLEEKTIGIIGVGNVGKKINHLAETLGMKCLLYDPPRAAKEGDDGFCSLKEIQEQADIITFHVPLTKEGDNATFHFVNDDFLKALKKKPLIINSCRGKVWDTEAVKRALKNNQISAFIADVWENEPNPDPDFINLAFLATPHIAGFSRDGKALATTLSVQAVAKTLKLPLETWHVPFIEAPHEQDIYWQDGFSQNEFLFQCILSTYPILLDDQRFRKNISLFESLRNNYPVRREFFAYRVHLPKTEKALSQSLSNLGFQVIFF